MQPSTSWQRLGVTREMSFSFSREQRLLTGSDYKAVFEQGKRSGNPYWTVYAWHHDQATTQLGLAIAKKTVRRAHERNRLKRLARETFRHLQSQLIGVNFVVMAGRAAESADNELLFAQLTKLLKRHITSSTAHNASSSANQQAALDHSTKKSLHRNVS